MSDSTVATCQEGERENVGIFMCNWKDILACTLICFKLILNIVLPYASIIVQNLQFIE